VSFDLSFLRFWGLNFELGHLGLGLYGNNPVELAYEHLVVALMYLGIGYYVNNPCILGTIVALMYKVFLCTSASYVIVVLMY
jgi:hypothetical protein